MLVLDTCALFWWVARPSRLSKKATHLVNRMESTGGLVSSISFWELGVKQEKGKIDLGVPLNEFCKRVEDTGILEILPVDLATWQAALSLDWKHRDPVDRVVVATAKTRGMTLVTADEQISKYYKKAVW